MGINVIALGGNAILENEPGDDVQKEVVRKVASDIVRFIETGEEVIICHGNGPQVGNILVQQKKADSEKTPMMKLDTNVAMTEGSMGYWIQQALQNELAKKGIKKDVISLVTQVEVDRDDPSFAEPSKPIGPFYSKAEAEAEMAISDALFVEDAGRGYRRVVASPKPKRILEKEVILSLVENGLIPICVGGGGIPVIKNQEGDIEGVEAVIDKDFSASVLATEIGADRLIILTGVDSIYINFNQPNQEELTTLNVAAANRYIAEGQFAPGSMLPKVEAGLSFVLNREGGETVITSLKNLTNIRKGSGTKIVN